MTEQEFDALARQVDNAIPEVHCAECLYLRRLLDATAVCIHPHALVVEKTWHGARPVRIPPEERNADLHCPDYVRATVRQRFRQSPLAAVLGMAVLLGIFGTLGWVAWQVGGWYGRGLWYGP